jgi:hypothetical protein
VKIIGVGFGRTGTASLKLALEQLGLGPCHHMVEIVQDPSRARAWLAAAEGRPDWDELFAGFNSTVDWPAAAFWRELIDAYPDAPVILTVRDPQSWYDSAAQTIFRSAGRSKGRLGAAMLRLVRLANPGFADFIALTEVVVNDRVFDGRAADRAHAIAVFEQHTAQVRATVPADRLLVFDVAQGWQPLCEFLGLPVPDEPFPRVNDTAEFNRQQAAHARRMMLPVAVAAGAVVATVLASGSFLLRRYRARR